MKTMDTTQVKLGLQLGKILCTLTFLIFLYIVSGGSSVVNSGLAPSCSGHLERPSGFLLKQTPPTLSVEEGSTLTMECRTEGNLSGFWYWEWFINKSDGTQVTFDKQRQLANKNINFTTEWIEFTLNRTDINDSGTYFCYAEDDEKRCILSMGTKVNITEITDLQVTQTLGPLEGTEGESFTLECHFKTVDNISTMFVSWHKDDLEGELGNKTGSLTIIQNLQEGFSSLTLTNTNVNDSGFYRCDVGSSSRNLSGSGKPSQIFIREVKQQEGLGSEATAGIGVGAFLLLVLLGVLVWKLKKSGNGTQVSTPETEVVPANDRKTHPPLTGQTSNVLYADLHFNRREIPSDTEVIYAEVKPKLK